MASERTAQARPIGEGGPGLGADGGWSINCEGSTFYGIARMDIIILGNTKPDIDWAALADLYLLSPRETQVLAGIWLDLKNSAIAFEMGISIHTVDSHWREVQRKMKVKGRVAAVRKVADFRLETHLAELRATLTPKMLPASSPVGGAEADAKGGPDCPQGALAGTPPAQYPYGSDDLTGAIDS